MARTVFARIQLQRMGGITGAASGAMPSVASAVPAANGTVMLSFTPSARLSAIAAASVATSSVTGSTSPNHAAMPNAAAPPAMTNAISPPQLLFGFHGRREIG